MMIVEALIATVEAVGARVMRMTPIKVFLLTIILLVALKAFSLPGVLVDYWWYGSLGQLEVFMTNLRAEWGIFFSAALLTGIVFYVNWRAAKSYLVKKFEIEEDTTKAIGSIYAFIGTLFVLWLASGLSEEYFTFLQYLYQIPFAVSDPIFGKDVGFYKYTLPLADALLWYIFWTAAALTIANAAAYLAVGRTEEVLDAKDLPFASRLPLGAIILFLAAKIYVWKYDLVTATGGSSFLTGAGKSILAVYPFWFTVVAVLLSLLALAVLAGKPRMEDRNEATVFTRYAVTVIAVVAIVFLGAILLPSVHEWGYHKLYIVSNEQDQQAPYINHSIHYTRAAYGINQIDEVGYPNNNQLNGSIVSSPAVESARVIDYRVMQRILTRDQTIEKIYSFNEPDVDRYLIGGKEEQVTVAARELNMAELPQTWEAQHILYTHGYGAVIGSVNKVTANRMPKLYMYNIPSISNGMPKVKTESIYYGENSQSYVITNTKRMEIDYPTSDGNNVYTAYDGTGGIPMGGFWKRLVIGWECGDIIKITRSEYITDESRIHIHRNVDERIQKVAPYLYLDKDNSLFIDEDASNLKWMVSGVAYWNGYPYSSVTRLGDMDVNYVVDAAKIVEDAKNGTMDFYVVTEDPLMHTYMNIYPHLFKGLEKMPESQESHLKYSEELYNVISGELCVFHMSDPEQYYSKLAQWKPSHEISDAGDSAVAMPYNMILENGNGTSYELIRTFNPAAEGRTNLVAWMSVNQDQPDYGKMLVYKFNKNMTISGPAQIDGFINQDKEFSKLLSLWGQQGSTVIRGNLLVIPVEGGLINIKPMYISSSSGTNSMPELAAVIVFYESPVTGERYLKWGDSVEEAMSQIFGEGSDSISPQGQENIQEMIKDVTGGIEIIILDADGKVVQRIELQKSQSFIAKPIKSTGNGSTA